jgi:Icc-related predicted phosphoesterase
MNYFREELPKHSDKPVVVITHHAPSFMSISEQYRGPGDYHMNGGYASDLSEFILDHPQIKAFVHGHVHSQHSYDIGDTRILCNPRGYVGHEAIANHFEVKSFTIDSDGNFIF